MSYNFSPLRLAKIKTFDNTLYSGIGVCVQKQDLLNTAGVDISQFIFYRGQLIFPINLYEKISKPWKIHVYIFPLTF